MRVVVTVSVVFVGCGLNAALLEVITKSDPGCGGLVTFAHYLFISAIGFFYTMKCGTRASEVPIREYAFVVVLLLFSNAANNFAFQFKIDMPLHMIIRSGSLVVNMLLTVLILKRSYSLLKWFSVILITLDISICSVMSTNPKPVSSAAVDVNQTIGCIKNHFSPNCNALTEKFSKVIGLMMMVLSLFLSARMGIAQEVLVSKYGKQHLEALFYVHVLALPAFVLLMENIQQHYTILYEKSEMISVAGLLVPELGTYLIGVLVTQYLCVSSVFFLVSEYTSLTVTLVTTLRKFASLLFSIIYFRNPFTPLHWIGTLLVFVGTVIFTDVINLIVVVLCKRYRSVKQTETENNTA